MKNSNINLRSALAVIACVFAISSKAQTATPSPDILNYIETYKSIAQEEMLRAGIPASITLAQGIHESNCGKSVLATDAKNHFGIKCHKEWTGPGYTYDDDAKGECFRIYNSAEHSYRDHSDFLTSRPRYAGLFTLDRTDYKNWAYGLKAAGYATNPKYPEILIRLIDEYRLHDYDNLQNIVAKKSTPAATPASVGTTAATEKPEVLEFQEKGSFNGVPCIVLETKATPKQIAEKYHMSLDDILSYNEMEDGDVFGSGDRVYFAHKKKVGDTEFHTVKKGESMWQIAQQHGIKIHKLYEKNRMRMNEQPLAGETIYLHQKSNVAPRTMLYEAYLKEAKEVNPPVAIPAIHTVEKNTLTASNDRIYNPITTKNYMPPADGLASDSGKENSVSYYEVQPKETLYSIARMFNTSVQQLKSWNNLSDSGLKVGQQLIVKQ